jgi:coenzyme Q-binding protein COQ10
MFALVADVEKYPQFLPHCAGLRILASEVADGSGYLSAEMAVAYGALRERFRCRVRLDRPALKIEVDYLDGPFRRLHNRWAFRDLAEGSEIDFTIAFELRNFLLQALASAAFERLFMRMSEAFVMRAAAVYG